ncbi:glycosyltransferase family 4 protein [Magnetospirillum fulvum]|uniref:glycosyltransferase family 4 protein n=1 Tax=Magnetospirillum fulvum TaxID=1082 RepID=UPI00111508C4|nr:glycosyltransferase family 4 protein [Magnetospirillum fulvum]
MRQYTPSIGGLEDAVGNLCRHLAELPDVHVRVVTLNRLFSDPGTFLPRHEILDGIPVDRIPFCGSRRYPFAPQVLAILGKADVVHVHAVDFFYDFLAFTRPLHRKPLVASTHGGFFHTGFAARLKKVYFQSVTRASSTAYHSICASSANDAATFSRIAGKRVITVENGVNIKKWHDTGSRVPVRTILFIGRWSTNKRIGVLIRLLAELRRCNPAWRLIVAGVPETDTPESLAAKAREVGVAEAVSFYIRPDASALAGLIGTAGYIASASDYEGFGLTIVEGMSAGLVPLVSEIPPFINLLDSLGLGSRISAEDLAASADTIETAHTEDPQTFATARARCIASAQAYAWPQVARTMHDIYCAAFAAGNRTR